MASKTLLLDLSNELFPFILQHLRSIDILKAFFDIQSCRLRALILPFIIRLDISQESNEWIENYLPKLFLQYEIIVLRIQMKHLTLISKYLLSFAIQSVEVINWDYDFDFSHDVVCQLRQNLKKLSLTFTELGEIHYQDIQFFQSDSQLEHLTIKNCVLYSYDVKLEICTRLIYLSVELEGLSPLFKFLERLPNLQELKVHIRSQECFGQPAPDINGIKPCKSLRTVTFTGWIKYFDHLESFFAMFGSTIEYLCLEISLMFLTVDGTRLEHKLLNRMPRLTSLNLNILSRFSDDTDLMKIETFQSSAWEQLNPIVYWYDIHDQQHMLFTLPYKLNRFEHLSNDFVTTYISNRPFSLCFNRVRTLSLINTTPLNLEMFLLIQKIFRNVTTIELTEKNVHPLAEEDDEEERSIGILSMSEDLLSNTSLQVPSVTTFCVAVGNERIDYKTFHRFLRLFPNLVNLELNISHPLLHDLLKHKNEDDLAEIVLARIKQLTINDCHEEDTLTDAEIHYLFPKVNSVIKTLDEGDE